LFVLLFSISITAILIIVIVCCYYYLLLNHTHIYLITYIIITFGEINIHSPAILGYGVPGFFPARRSEVQGVLQLHLPQDGGEGCPGRSYGMSDVPSGYVKIAIEHTPFIVDLPIQNGDFL
jgi:hypothetical protein